MKPLVQKQALDAGKKILQRVRRRHTLLGHTHAPAPERRCTRRVKLTVVSHVLFRFATLHALGHARGMWEGLLSRGLVLLFPEHHLFAFVITI